MSKAAGLGLSLTHILSAQGKAAATLEHVERLLPADGFILGRAIPSLADLVHFSFSVPCTLGPIICSIEIICSWP